jgi:hypothetical protein
MGFPLPMGGFIVSMRWSLTVPRIVGWPALNRSGFAGGCFT